MSFLDAAAMAPRASQRVAQLCDLSSARVPVKKAHPQALPKNDYIRVTGCRVRGSAVLLPVLSSSPVNACSQPQALVKRAHQDVPTERSAVSPRAWGGLEKAVALLMGKTSP